MCARGGQVSRHLARLTVTAFDWEADPAAKVRCRKVLRLIVLHFFVVIECARAALPSRASDAETVAHNCFTGPSSFKVQNHSRSKGVWCGGECRYFQRTGQNMTRNDDAKDALRENIRRLTGEKE